MNQTCLRSLEQAIVTHLPAFILANRRAGSELFAVRPHFYDTSAPECYFNCAFIYTPTAERIMNQPEATRFRDLWAYGEECGDHWELFPQDSPKQGSEINEIMESCYEFLCDDDLPQSYDYYAYAICYAALTLNQNVCNVLDNIHPCFAIVPADAAPNALDDSKAIHLSVPGETLMRLDQQGFLDLTATGFGIYPEGD